MEIFQLTKKTADYNNNGACSYLGCVKKNDSFAHIYKE